MAIELPHVLKNMNLFVDGRGYAGRVDEIKLPKLTLKTEEHRAGGMDIPVELELGMDKLEAELDDFRLSIRRSSSSLGCWTPPAPDHSARGDPGPGHGGPSGDRQSRGGLQGDRGQRLEARRQEHADAPGGGALLQAHRR